MPNSKPKIFLSSTIYDFNDLRSALKYWFEEFGYEVLASDHNDFPVDSDRNSYDNCLRSIDQCDYFILLIGGRVGGWYDKDKEISITRAEYQHAYEKSKNGSIKIISFVRQCILDIREDRRQLADVIKGKKPLCNLEDIAYYTSKLLENPQFTFDFIDEVARKKEMKNFISEGEERPIGNWITPFERFDDIARRLRVDLKISGTLNEKRLIFNLKNEILQNLTYLCECCRGKIMPKSTWLDGIAKKCKGQNINGSAWLDNNEMYRIFVFELHISTLHLDISNRFLEEAISNGCFLKYDMRTNEYEETLLHKALSDVSNYLVMLKREKTNWENELLAKIGNMCISKVVSKNFKNLHLAPFLSNFLRLQNATMLLKRILKYLEGDDAALNGYEDELVETKAFMTDESIELENKTKPTKEQILAWIKT